MTTEIFYRYIEVSTTDLSMCVVIFLSSQADLTVCSANGKNLIIANFAHILT